MGRNVCPARKRLVHAKMPRRKDSQSQTETLPAIASDSKDAAVFGRMIENDWR